MRHSPRIEPAVNCDYLTWPNHKCQAYSRTWVLALLARGTLHFEYNSGSYHYSKS